MCEKKKDSDIPEAEISETKNKVPPKNTGDFHDEHDCFGGEDNPHDHDLK